MIVFDLPVVRDTLFFILLVLMFFSLIKKSIVDVIQTILIIKVVCVANQLV